MLHDEFRLVVVVVIFIEVYGWKIHYYRTDKWPDNVVTRKT